jgi:lysophospholipase L1-like esterase
MPDYLNLFILLILCSVIGEALWITYFGLKSKLISKNVKSFSVEPKNPKRRILVIGDSVVLGVGASDGAHSLVGKIAELYPTSSVIGCGMIGGKTENVLEMLKRKKIDSKLDLIIIMCGGMDVLHFTPPEKYRRNLSDLFKEAKKYTTNVTYILMPNAGVAPIFPFPVSLLYTYYSRKLCKVAQEVTSQEQVTPIHLFNEKKNDPLYGRFDLYADDLSHPNNKGYSVWFGAVKTVIQHI